MNRLDDRLLAYLTLFTGLSISAVAIYYSVAGLIAIFSASPIPIVIMGVVLEIGKLVATIWLKQNWSISPRSIKVYLISAIALLMFITSMGIFGFLSKAHLDQSVPVGDVAAELALYEEKIKTERENIDAGRKSLNQLDAAVDQILSRSNDERGAERSAQLRRNQRAERDRLFQEIDRSQKKIAELNEQRAPIAAKMRTVEAEVGPIKYIAALIYGNDPDKNMLEKSVSWMIILLILVFDPLAVVLLLASQYSFQQSYDKNTLNAPAYEKDDGPLTSDQLAQISDSAKGSGDRSLDSKIQLEVKEHRGGEVLVNYYLKMIKSGQLSLSQIPTQQLRQKIEKILNEK